MRRFVLGWKKLGLERSLGTRLVTYADDLVILCRRGNAESALHHLREIMDKLKLTTGVLAVNPWQPDKKGHGYYAVLKDGITVAEAVKPGCPRGYIAWNIAHQYIALKPKS
jgi:hypothetical protein